MKRSVPPLVALLLLLGAVQAHAQRAHGSVAGRVLDEATDQPVAGVRVVLIAPDGNALHATVTPDRGTFHFARVPPGLYRLRTSRIGYEERTTGGVEVREERITSIAVRLPVHAVEIEPVRVTTRAGSGSPVLDDFYHRVEVGMGHYLTRQDIARFGSGSLSDLLTRLPGVRTYRNRQGARQVYFGRALVRHDGCPAQVFLDGVLMNRSTSRVRLVRDSAFVDLDEDINFAIDEIAIPSELEGVEVYPGLASTPAEFIGPNARCGTVAVWSRRR